MVNHVSTTMTRLVFEVASGLMGLYFFAEEGDQLLYNVEKVECDYDRNVDCGARPICDTNNQNCHDQGDDPEPDDNRCQGKEDGYHPNMANCRKYLHCFEENVEEELLCPTGL